jgi:hypothetical protein
MEHSVNHRPLAGLRIGFGGAGGEQEEGEAGGDVINVNGTCLE